MKQFTIRFKVPTLPDLSPSGLRRMFFSCGYWLVNKYFEKQNHTFLTAQSALQQSNHDYQAVESELATLTTADQAVRARNSHITVAGYELLDTDGFQVIEWAILDAEYKRLHLDDLFEKAFKADKKRRNAEGWRYYWQIMRDRA